MEFYSKSSLTIDNNNIPGYNNPKMDELYLKLGSAYDKEERKKIFQEAEKIVRQ